MRQFRVWTFQKAEKLSRSRTSKKNRDHSKAARRYSGIKVRRISHRRRAALDKPPKSFLIVMNVREYFPDGNLQLSTSWTFLPFKRFGKSAGCFLPLSVKAVQLSAWKAYLPLKHFSWRLYTGGAQPKLYHFPRFLPRFPIVLWTCLLSAWRVRILELSTHATKFIPMSVPRRATSEPISVSLARESSSKCLT